MRAYTQALPSNTFNAVHLLFTRKLTNRKKIEVEGEDEFVIALVWDCSGADDIDLRGFISDAFFATGQCLWKRYSNVNARIVALHLYKLNRGFWQLVLKTTPCLRHNRMTKKLVRQRCQQLPRHQLPSHRQVQHRLWYRSFLPQAAYFIRIPRLLRLPP